MSGSVKSSYINPQKLAQGGMAELYVVEDELGRKLVIKRILACFTSDQSMQQMFAEEVKLVSLLEHPNIVPFIDKGEDAAGQFIVFEFIDGVDLLKIFKDKAQKQQKMSVHATFAWLLPLLKALAYAHDLKDDTGQKLHIVHRDLTPENILLSQDGSVYLADFGVASSCVRQLKTVVGEMRGKFAYMSPEQSRGESLDCRSDLFSLGILIYEALTAQRAFDALSDLDVVQKVREHRLKKITDINPDVPVALAELVEQLLEKDPKKRPSSAQSVLEQCQTIANDCFCDRHLSYEIQQLVKNVEQEKTELVESELYKRRTRKVTSATFLKEQDAVKKNSGKIFVLLLLLIISLVGLAWKTTSWLEQSRIFKVITNKQAQNSQLKQVKNQNFKTEQRDLSSENQLLNDKQLKKAQETLRAGKISSLQKHKKLLKKLPKKLKIKQEKRKKKLGSLKISSEPWAWVYFDGEKIKETPVYIKNIKAGIHKVKLVNPYLKKEKSFQVRIKAEHLEQRFVDLR